MTRTVTVQVPGRVCLVGEHSDWLAGMGGGGCGYAVCAATNESIECRATSAPAALPTLTLTSCMTAEVYSGAIDRARFLAAAKSSSFYAYQLGVMATRLFDLLPAQTSLTLDNVAMTLPLKKGLSSSAAICVLTVRAVNLLFALGLGVEEEMDLAYLGERNTASLCGRMDQCVAALAPGDAALLEFSPHGTVRVTRIEPVPRPVYVLVADLNGKKDTVSILASLQAGARAHANVRALFGPKSEALCGKFVAALKVGDALELNALYARAQADFDAVAAPLCPAELGAPLLHKALEAGRAVGAFGKLVGAGGDGTAQFVCASQRDRETLKRALANAGFRSWDLTLAATRRAPGL